MNTANPRYEVIGLGASTLDLLMVVDELPGGEIVQRAHQSVLEGGGPVATAMVTLARLGARAAMVDKLGDDWRGKLIAAEFEREGVSTGYLVAAAHSSSSIASIMVRQGDGARAITYSPGDAGELLPDELPADAFASVRILHLNGRHLAASLVFAKEARNRGVPVSFDGGAHRYRKELDDLIALTDICIVAREFAFSFSGADDLQAAATSLLDSGPGLVVITAGSEGSWVFQKEGEPFRQAAFLVDAIDTTGAGDAYHGAFLFGVLRGYSLRSCALLASAVAALNTRSLGGREALPSLQEALHFLGERGERLEEMDGR